MPELPTQSAFMDFNQQPRMTSSGINQGLDHLYGYMHPGQSVQYVNYPGYERPYNYSISTMQTHAEQISLLQQENAALRAENQMLIQELQHSNSCSNIGLEATPRKIHFLQNLCTALEQKMHYRGYNSTITSNKESEVLHESTVNMPTLVRPKSRRLAFTESSARHDHEESPFTENAARHEHGERQPSTHREEDFEPERGSTEGDTKRNGCSQAYWEQRVTMNGALKVRLIPESEVYLTAQQLSQRIQKAGTNARKLIINFLDVFFKREVLAISSAKGKRVAHNSKLADSGEKTEALPEEVLNAIKRFTEKHIRKITGQFSLTDAVMNNVINSKCATARRALHNSNV
ncbi:uncharacterized protein LOC106173933 [Lingula anatina]|uniref:Uncharacterized protein LOC106173933 n=1 Tax=Lingula anatina TaxID=7574 RepID=A0A1S3JK32_LINAN|nr:uncharacterized protein LOC106173933 [Lingula anatina]|eukprot:XP_013410728.1 uncharacterized protein LOC106173933 [Lingula anatina]